jgi:hypothetical protein
MRQAACPEPIRAILLLGVLGLLGALGSAAPARAADLHISATLGPSRIGMDETALLTIQVRGGGFSHLRFRPDFLLDNLEIVGGPYQYDDVRFGNGLMTRTFRLSWRVRPLVVGRAKVRDIHIFLNGQEVRIGDRDIQVQEQPTGLSAGGEDGGDAGDGESDDPFDNFLGRPWSPWSRERPQRPMVFLRSEIRPLNPVVGQQVLYTVYLFTRNDVAAISTTSMPTFKGFWTRDIPQPQHLPTDMVEYDGQRYGRVVLLQKALFPLRAGRHNLEPTEMDVLVRTVDRSFFGPPMAQNQQAHLRTPSMDVDVQPLPPAPSGFSGAVGRMSMTARVEPQEVRIGDAATVTLTLSGEGNLQGVPSPQLPEQPGLTVLAPQQQSNEQVAGTVVRGERTWRYVVVPEKPGTYDLRLPALPYFDPQAGQYRTAAPPELQIAALPPLRIASADRSPEIAATGPLKDAVRRPSWRPGLPDWRATLPWLAIPCGLALVLTLVRRRRNGIPGRPAARHELEKELHGAAAEPRPRQAAARIEEAWRAFLSERWEVPPGTPSPRWGELLEARGADPAAARELVRLADDLHYLRYAPQLSARETLCAEVIDRSRRVLGRLR